MGWLVGGSILALAAVFMVYWISGGFFIAIRDIELPLATPSGQQLPGNPTPTWGQPPSTPIARVEVNADSLLSVLKEMKRAETYSASVAVEHFWQGGSGVNRHTVYHKNGMTKIEKYNDAGAVIYNKLYADGMTFAWTDRPPVHTAQTDPVGSDSAEGIPTYENLLYADRRQIQEATFVIEGNRPFIYVEWTDDISGYRLQYWISTEFNLLERAVAYQDTEKAYAMTVEGIPSREADDARFVLP